MAKPRIALDMDEVIADVFPKFLMLYQEAFGKPLEREAYWGKKIYEIPGVELMKDHLYRPGFFRDLPVIEGAIAGVQRLMEDYEVFITTAAQEFRHSLGDKHDWLQEHFPFISKRNYVMCGDKSILKADYMLDDHAYNFKNFEGQGVLYTASHNLDETAYPRVNNWKEVLAYFANELEK